MDCQNKETKANSQEGHAVPSQSQASNIYAMDSESLSVESSACTLTLEPRTCSSVCDARHDISVNDSVEVDFVKILQTAPPPCKLTLENGPILLPTRVDSSVAALPLRSYAAVDNDDSSPFVPVVYHDENQTDLLAHQATAVSLIGLDLSAHLVAALPQPQPQPQPLQERTDVARMHNSHNQVTVAYEKHAGSRKTTDMPAMSMPMSFGTLACEMATPCHVAAPMVHLIEQDCPIPFHSRSPSPSPSKTFFSHFYLPESVPVPDSCTEPRRSSQGLVSDSVVSSIMSAQVQMMSDSTVTSTESPCLYSAPFPLATVLSGNNKISSVRASSSVRLSTSTESQGRRKSQRLSSSNTTSNSNSSNSNSTATDMTVSSSGSGHDNFPSTFTTLLPPSPSPPPPPHSEPPSVSISTSTLTTSSNESTPGAIKKIRLSLPKKSSKDHSGRDHDKGVSESNTLVNGSMAQESMKMESDALIEEIEMKREPFTGLPMSSQKQKNKSHTKRKLKEREKQVNLESASLRIEDGQVPSQTMPVSSSPLLKRRPTRLERRPATWSSERALRGRERKKVLVSGPETTDTEDSMAPTDAQSDANSMTSETLGQTQLKVRSSPRRVAKMHHHHRHHSLEPILPALAGIQERNEPDREEKSKRSAQFKESPHSAHAEMLFDPAHFSSSHLLIASEIEAIDKEIENNPIPVLVTEPYRGKDISQSLSGPLQPTLVKSQPSNRRRAATAVAANVTMAQTSAIISSTLTSSSFHGTNLSMATLSATASPTLNVAGPIVYVGPPSLSTPGSQASNGGASKLLNEDHCDACRGTGHFICCERCPKSYHWLCAEPPLDPLDVKDSDHWYCKKCSYELTTLRSSPLLQDQALQQLSPTESLVSLDNTSPPPLLSLSSLPASTLQAPLSEGSCSPLKHYFGALGDTVRKMNPKEFALPDSIRRAFEGVTWDQTTGQYVDMKEYRTNPKAVRCEGFDGSRSLPMVSSSVPALSHASSTTTMTTTATAAAASNATTAFSSMASFFCHGCGKSALHGALLSCDFCPLSWHLDCLDPPLSAPPPATRKYMCPSHSDHYGTRLRRRRDAMIVFTNDPFIHHAGEVSVFLDNQRHSESSSFERPKPTIKVPLPRPSNNRLANVVFCLPESSIKIGFRQRAAFDRAESMVAASLENDPLDALATIALDVKWPSQ